MKRWSRWVVDRFGLRPIWDKALKRRVPRSPWYYGDGFTLLTLLGILVLTGMFMTLTYAPTPDGAYESVRYITEHQTLGWFVRGLHYWSAGMMMVMVVFHLCRILLVGGYKAPREGTFLVGVMLLFSVLLMGITGYILRWDERGLYAMRVVLHHLDNVPLIGEYLVLFVQGGPELGARTLTRTYGIHVVFVPLTLLLLTGVHLYLVLLKGITSKSERQEPIYSVTQQKRLYKQESESEEGGESFFPETVVASGLMAVAVTGLVFLLTLAIGPQALFPEANLTEPTVPEEEWWFWWYSALIAQLPPALAPIVVVALPVMVFIVLVLLPFIDRSPYRGIKRRPWMAVTVAGLVIVLLVLSNLRYFSPWTGWPSSEPPAVPPGAEITESAEEGRQLFALYGCNSCHAVAGDGPRVGPDLARIDAPMDHEELRLFILSPPEDVAMPAYKGRITEAELHRIVEFVLVAQTFRRE
ncbi:MAG: cytochrome b N-terminal domain-containing protein [Bacteroidota bacterium]